MDEDLDADDLIGEAVIKISALCVNSGIDEWFEIQYKGKPAGRVHMKS
jgi:hypothetical protein